MASTQPPDSLLDSPGAARPVAPIAEKARTASAQLPLTLWFTSLMLLFLAVQGVRAENPTPALNRCVAITWLLSVAAFGYSVLRSVGWRPPRLAALAAGLRAHRLEVLAAVGIGLAALALRTYQLTDHPYAFINDEGSVGLEAVDIWHGWGVNLFTAGWSGYPRWAFVPTAISVGLFGNTPFAVRIVSALAGALTVVFLYLMGREAFGPAVGLLAAGFLAALPVHVHFSRLGVGNVVDGLFGAVVLWLTVRAIRRDRVSSYLWAGLAAGLTIYVYLGSRLVLGLAVGLLAYQSLRQRGYFSAHLVHLLVFAGAAVVVAAPMAVYFAHAPDTFMARVNSEAIFRNNWIADQMATGKTFTEVLLDQFAKSSLVYITQPAAGGFFSSPVPLLSGVGAIFALIGMGVAFWRSRQPFYLVTWVWFWSVVIFGGVLTINAPASERLVGSLPPLALFVAFGLTEAVGLARRFVVLPARWGLALCAGAVALTGLQGVSFYFGQYRRVGYFNDGSNELILESLQYALREAPNDRMFMITAPFVKADFPNFNYLAPDIEKQDLDEVTPDTLAALPHDRGALFIALPEHRDDLETVAQYAPGGKWLEVPRKYRDGLLYLAYQVPASVWRAVPGG
jgi:4-amino-4-deoxy-L-arabinose transferase-like glycosyltransferase